MCLGFFISKLTVFEEHEKELEREELNVNKTPLWLLYKQNIATSMAKDFPV